MIECPHCGRLFPEVVGAPSQACPHCDHEFEVGMPSPRSRSQTPVDPVGAITEAARVAARSYPRFLLLYLPVLALELAIGFGLDAYSTSIGIGSVDAMTDGQRMQFLGLGVPLIVLLFTLRVALWTFVGVVVLREMGVRAAPWRALVGPSILLGFVLTLTFVAGIAFLLVGFVVFLHWFMYAPAQLASGASSVAAAFDRSRRFAREQRTYGFTAVVALVGGAIVVAYFIASSVGGVMGKLAPSVVSWLGGPVVPLLAASYVGLAARGGPAPVKPAPSSAPAARSNAKCPQCATLIPYESTGAPVDVVCPTCGYTGKVL